MDDPGVKARELETTLAECRRLKEENAALRQLLADNGITIPTTAESGPQAAIRKEGQDAGVNEHSGKDAKVTHFRSLFRGREDVYAVRKQFKSGEWGYVPASIRDWKAVLSAAAALRKKVDQKTRKLLPLTDDVLRQHLEGTRSNLILLATT
jgi:hypothetical protein